MLLNVSNPDRDAVKRHQGRQLLKARPTGNHPFAGEAERAAFGGGNAELDALREEVRQLREVVTLLLSDPR